MFKFDFDLDDELDVNFASLRVSDERTQPRPPLTNFNPFVEISLSHLVRIS